MTESSENEFLELEYKNLRNYIYIGAIIRYEYPLFQYLEYEYPLFQYLEVVKVNYIKGFFRCRNGFESYFENSLFFAPNDKIRISFPSFIPKQKVVSTSSNPQPNFMNNVLNFFRKLTLSAADKVLQETGLEDPVGVPTSQGISLLLEVLWKENRDKIVKLAEEMKAEQERKEEYK